MNATPKFDTGSAHQRFGSAVCEIGRVARYVRIFARYFDATVRAFDRQLICQPDRHHQRADFMKPIVALPQNLEGEVDFSGGVNLQNVLQFQKMLSGLNRLVRCSHVGVFEQPQLQLACT